MKYPTELLEKLTLHATALDWGNVADTLGELADFVGAEVCRHDVQTIGLKNLDGPVVLGPDADAYRRAVAGGIRSAFEAPEGAPVPEPFRTILEDEYTTGRIVGAYERELERQEDLRCDPKGILP